MSPLIRLQRVIPHFGCDSNNPDNSEPSWNMEQLGHKFIRALPLA